MSHRFNKIMPGNSYGFGVDVHPIKITLKLFVANVESILLFDTLPGETAQPL